MSACFPSRSGAWKIPRTAATAGLFSPGSARKGRRIWQGRRRRRLPGPCMNGGWRAWRKGTALHYRKNCLPFNVNKQAGEDGVCGGRISVPVCPERRTLPESRECSGRKLVLAVRDEWPMMLGEWGKRGTTDFSGHAASVRMFFLCRKDRLKTQGFLLPVQQGGNAFSLSSAIASREARVIRKEPSMPSSSAFSSLSLHRRARLSSNWSECCRR